MQTLQQNVYLWVIFFLLFMTLPVKAVQMFDPALLRSQSPGQVLRFSPPPMASMSDLDRASSHVKASYAVSNLWGHDRGYMIDAQVDDSLCELTYRFATELSLTIGFGQRTFKSSKTDEVIIGFHDLIGSPQGKRLQVEADQSRMSLPGYNLDIANASIDSAFSHHIYTASSFQKQFNGSTTQLSIGGIFYQSTSDGLSSASSDQGFGIRSRLDQKIQAFNLYSEMALMQHDNHHAVSKHLKPKQLEARLGLAYHLEKAHDMYLQSLISEAAFDGFGQLARPSFEVHLGYRYTGRYLALDLGMIENILYPFNSPDWGVFVGLSAANQ